jgi:hypothetical protein
LQRFFKLNTHTYESFWSCPKFKFVFPSSSCLARICSFVQPADRLAKCEYRIVCARHFAFAMNWAHRWRALGVEPGAGWRGVNVAQRCSGAFCREQLRLSQPRRLENVNAFAKSPAQWRSCSSCHPPPISSFLIATSRYLESRLSHSKQTIAIISHRNISQGFSFLDESPHRSLTKK